MSARANAPVFQLHPSATNINSPNQSHVPLPSQNFTSVNASPLVPHPPHQQHPQHQHPHPHQPQTPQPQHPGPMHSYHQRTDSNSSGQGQGRRRNSSFSKRRTDARLRSSVPPQLSTPLPQLQPASEADLVSGPRSTSALEIHSGVKREGDSGGYMEPYFKRRRQSDCLRADSEARSLGGQSPDRSSQRSGTGSVRSLKKEPDEPTQAGNEATTAAT